MTTCKDVMTLDPICCLISDTAIQAANLMRDADVGPILVIEDPESKKLIGIVTDRDLAMKVVADGQDSKKINIGDVMTRDPVRCHVDEDVQAVLERMSGYQVRRIPVVDAENRVVGIISQADIANRIQDPETVGEIVQEISEK
jgi:CBS domain-containing protein